MKTSIKQLRQIIREEVIRDQRAIMQQERFRKSIVDSIVPVQGSDNFIRMFIREELIIEQRWEAHQQILREGFIDNVKKLYKQFTSQPPQPADKKEKEKIDVSAIFSNAAEKASELANFIAKSHTEIQNILNSMSLGEAGQKIEDFMFKGLGSLSQTKYDLNLLINLFNNVADVIDDDPTRAKKLMMATLGRLCQENGSENLSLDAKTTRKSSEVFVEVASIFAELSSKVSTYTDVLQSSFPGVPSGDGDELVSLGLGHVSIASMANGTLGSFGQTSKDLTMLSDIFSEASKTIDKNAEETQKKMHASIQLKLGKATSS